MMKRFVFVVISGLFAGILVPSVALAIDGPTVIPPAANEDVPPEPELAVPGATPPAAAEQGFVEPRPGQLPPRHRGWYLGVYGHYTSTGMLLTQVFPGTPAERVGLEVGDRLVAVNGRQIGVVLDSRLTLDVALQREASARGHVRLLVQDHRTLRLVNIDVQLVRSQVHF